MIFKAFLGTGTALAGLCFINESFYHKFDRNILRPVRDYRSFLSDYNRI